MNCNCEGCKQEIIECYKYQCEGYDTGLDWYNGHCFFMAFDKNGGWIAG